MAVKIYCSGSIIKGANDSNKLCWSDVERQEIRKSAEPCDITFLNPDDPVADLSDSEALFGRDMFQIEQCNTVVIDGRERRGIGIGVELLAAKHFRRPVIGIIPPNSYYRQSNVAYRGGFVDEYIHPHFATLLDTIVDDFSAAGLWIRDELPVLQVGTAQDVLDRAVTAYRHRLLSSDTPMREIFG